MLIDVAIPNNNNLRQKHNEKILKYRDLQEQVRRQWQMQWRETIPIVLSSTGVIPKVLLESIKKLDLDTKIIRNMQKAVMFTFIIIIIPDLTRRLHTPSKGNIHSFQISRISKELSSVGVLSKLSDPT